MIYEFEIRVTCYVVRSEGDDFTSSNQSDVLWSSSGRLSVKLT